MEMIWQKRNVLTNLQCTNLIKAFEYEHRKDNTHDSPAYSNTGNNSRSESIQPNLKNVKAINIKKDKRYSIYIPNIEKSLKNAFYDYISEKSINTKGSLQPDFDKHQKGMVNASSIFFPFLMIARYKQNEGHINGWHVDKRFGRYRVYEHNGRYIVTEPAFVMTTYLNTVRLGGRTQFYNGKKLKPMEGNTIIFPTTFPYVHKASKPRTNHKYILTTHLCYDVSTKIASIYNDHSDKGWLNHKPQKVEGDLYARL